jgi:spermidine synthase
VIGKNKHWGTVLLLDDVTNVAERDEFIYHEMMAHVPMLTHPDPRRVLIVGGGDGGSAREILKHPNLENVVMIDIDADVVNLSKKYLPSVSDGAFEDPRLNLIIGDGIEFVMKAEDSSFDVIIVDSTDPNPDSIAEALFTDEFYTNCDRVLSPQGVIATQSLTPLRFVKEIYQNSIKTLQKAFTKERTYAYLIPTDSYGAQTSLALCFKGDSHPHKLNKARVDAFEKEHNL